jgi:hypothetical protein
MRQRLMRLRALALEVVAACRHDSTLAYWIADDFLRAVAIAWLGWAWEQIAAAPASGGERWTAPAQALQSWILPEFDMRHAIITQRMGRAAQATGTHDVR